MAQQWAPSVQDVANLLRARTVSRNGGELGSFSSLTRPTDVEVSGLIDQAYNDVVNAIGQITAVPSNQVDSVTTLIALGAAKKVELSYYPEQIGTGRSPYQAFAQEYKDQLTRLQNAIVSVGGNRPTDEYMTPAGNFGGPPVQAGWILPQW